MITRSKTGGKPSICEGSHLSKGEDKFHKELSCDQSLKDQVASHIELDCWDHICDELHEDQQREVRLHFLFTLHHGVGHRFKHFGMFARMHCRHAHVHERELFHRDSLVEVVLVDVLINSLRREGLKIIVCGCEIHAWHMIPLVVNNVHCVVANILFLLLVLHFRRAEHSDPITSLLALHILLDNLGHHSAQPASAHHLF